MSSFIGILHRLKNISSFISSSNKASMNICAQWFGSPNMAIHQSSVAWGITETWVLSMMYWLDRQQNDSSWLTHWDRDQMATAFLATFSDAFSWISTKISLRFVPINPINNIPALVQIIAWLRSGDKPISKPMVVSLLTHLCVTWPQ